VWKGRKEQKKMDAEEALTDALDDVQTRFLLNLPENELSSADRIFFQLEQAHWYYEVRPNPVLREGLPNPKY
jgi:hypothetical protein